MNEQFMQRAIQLAIDSVENNGGPFGAVLVKDGVIVGEGSNSVTINNAPTAHAEVAAIRDACKRLDTFDLSGCEIYTSCEPCPMCLSSMYWARITGYYYGCTQHDAQNIGFDDSYIYKQVALNIAERDIKAIQCLHQEALSAFAKWNEKEDKTEY